MYREKATVLGDIDGFEYKTWCRYLVNIKPEQIAYAMEQLLSREDEWPPHVKEFHRLCTNMPEPESYKYFQKLPVKKSSKEYAQPYLDELKRIVKSFT